VALGDRITLASGAVDCLSLATLPISAFYSQIHDEGVQALENMANLTISGELFARVVGAPSLRASSTPLKVIGTGKVAPPGSPNGAGRRQNIRLAASPGRA
jgi:hypothetical protein